VNGDGKFTSADDTASPHGFDLGATAATSEDPLDGLVIVPACIRAIAGRRFRLRGSSSVSSSSSSSRFSDEDEDEEKDEGIPHPEMISGRCSNGGCGTGVPPGVHGQDAMPLLSQRPRSGAARGLRSGRAA
jgi:hypothetical protein